MANEFQMPESAVLMIRAAVQEHIKDATVLAGVMLAMPETQTRAYTVAIAGAMISATAVMAAAHDFKTKNINQTDTEMSMAALRVMVDEVCRSIVKGLAIVQTEKEVGAIIARKPGKS